MRVVLFGYSSTGVRVLRTLTRMDLDIRAVFTHPDNPGETIWFDSVARMVQDLGLPCHLVSTANPKGPVPYEGLVADCAPDVILSASLRSLIPTEVLAHARLAALNLHPSLLPRYRGRCPVNWVLLRGERETGMSLHHMVRGADAGDIVGQMRLDIGPDETAPELQARMEDCAETLLQTYLPLVAEGRAPRIPQNPRQQSTFGRRTAEDGRFEWSWPARRIHDLVRAVTRPFPGAFSGDGAERLYLWKTRVVPGAQTPRLAPGEMTTIEGRPHPVVGTGNGTLEILESSRAGEPARTA